MRWLRRSWRLLVVTVLILFLLRGNNPRVAFAQEAQLDLPEESGPAPVQPARPIPPRAAAKAPPEDEAKVRAAPEGPQASPQVELERRPLKEALSTMANRLLNILTTDNGTNRTAVIGRAQLSSEYRDRRGSGVSLSNVARVDVPLATNLLWRTDADLSWFDPQTSGSNSVAGIGDVSTRLGARIWERPAFTAFFEFQVVFPTAGNDNLGRGKYQLVPGLTFSLPISRLDTGFFPGIQQSVSVGGDPSRNDVNFTKLSFEFTTPWANNLWWTTVEPDLIVDWTQKAKTAMNLEFEAGRRLGNHFRIWLRPAVGLWGTGVPGAYDWYAQIGIRYMF